MSGAARSREPGRFTAGPPLRARRRRGLWLIAVAVAAVAAVCLGATLFYAATVSRSITTNLHRVAGLLPAAPASPPAHQPDDTGANSALNVLLIGSDSRATGDPGAGRSDSLMLAHLDADRKKAYIISIPRDLWVSVPGHGKAKINAAYSWGGAPLTVRTVQNLLGIKVDHVALTDFEGFIRLTDDLGGVSVNNEYPTTYHGYSYPAGPITLEGNRALWYVRDRHQLPHGDLDRAKRQREVVQAILAKGLSADTLSNPVKFNSFVAELAKSITVDDSLTDTELRNIALSLRLTGADIKLLQAPISGFATINGQDVDVVDQAGLAQLAAALGADNLASYQQ